MTDPTPRTFNSFAGDWRGLAQDLNLALQRLEGMNRKGQLATISRSILLSIEPDLQGIRLEWCSPDADAVCIAGHALIIRCPMLRPYSCGERDDGITPPHSSIDRAISRLAADMLSWSKDPETCEVIEQQRYRLFMRWPGEAAEPVYEWAYGLWDE